MSPFEPAVPLTGDSGLLRVRMQVSYDGAPFSGWAVQPGRLTVQGVIEEGLATLLRRPVRLTVAGRTDAGVHARGQVVHWEATEAEWLGLSRGKDIDPGVALRRRLRGVMNYRLLQASAVTNSSGPGAALDSFRGTASEGAIEIHTAEPAPPGFDARFSALWRRYGYRIADDVGSWDPLTRTTTLWHRAALDVEAMNDAVQVLVGLQDFRAFCRPRPGATTTRELQQFRFNRGDRGIITATIQADAFCHNMVRYLVGAAMEIGTGNRDATWLTGRLESKVRDAHAVIAPAHPLVLEEVGYPEAGDMPGRAELTRARRAIPFKDER